MKLRELALGFVVLAASSTAHAHLSVTSHTSRLSSADQKVGPCGRANSTRGTKVYTYKPGETITVEVDEYIGHPGWFRVSFDDDGDDDFRSPESIDPPSFMDNDTVLMDNLDPHDFGGGTRTWEVKLPDVECENCTLQIIQVMLDKLPYDPQDTGAFSNDIYYTCIDLTLKSDGAGEPDAAKPAPSDAGVGSSGGSDAGDVEDSDASAADASSGGAVDAGRASGRDAGGSSSGAQARDAGRIHDEHEDEEADEEEASREDEEDEDEDKAGDEKASDATASESGGCALGASPSSKDDGGLFMTLLSIATGLVVIRRRRNS